MARIAVDGNYQFDNDVNSLCDAIAGNGVVSGLAVTEKGAGANMSVDVASGYYVANGTKVTYAGGNVVVTAASGSNPRKDIIIGDSAGAITCVAGTAATADPVGSTGPQTYAPAPPDITANKIILAEIWVGTSVSTIVNANITDRRVILPQENILDNTVGGTDGETTKAPTSNVLYDINQLRGYKNFVINGNFTVNQRSATYTSATTPANNDNTNIIDRWRLLSDGNNVVSVSTGFAVLTPFRNRAVFTTVTANKKWGILQVIPQKDSKYLLNEIVSLQAKILITGMTNMRLAILSWSGTGDATTADPISDWEAGSATDLPTLAANWAYVNTPVQINPTAAWVKYAEEAVTMPTVGTVNNIAIFIFCNSISNGAGTILYLTDVQLEYGGCTSMETKPLVMNLAQCKRFHNRIAGDNAGAKFGTGFAYATTQANIWVPFPVEMRAAPTALLQSGTATDYSVYMAAGVVVACNAVPVFLNSNKLGADIYLTVDAGLTAGEAVMGRFVNTAGFLGWDAEI